MKTPAEINARLFESLETIRQIKGAEQAAMIDHAVKLYVTISHLELCASARGDAPPKFVEFLANVAVNRLLNLCEVAGVDGDDFKSCLQLATDDLTDLVKSMGESNT